MTEAVVLLSGGVDSATLLALAVKEHMPENVLAVTIDYGQKHSKEREAAFAVATHYNVTLVPVDLPRIFAGGGRSSLVDQEVDQPEPTSYEEFAAEVGPGPTVVPFRNANLLSVATTIAVVNECSYVYAAFHAGDSHNDAYPDCTLEFVGAFAAAMYMGTYHQVRLRTPLLYMDKSQVVRLGLRMLVPYELTWTCYRGLERPCRKCPACVERHHAFEANLASDPAYINQHQDRAG